MRTESFDFHVTLGVIYGYASLQFRLAHLPVIRDKDLVALK